MFNPACAKERSPLNKQEENVAIQVNFEDMITLASSLMQQGNLKQAEVLLLALKQQFDYRPEVLFRLGMIHYTREEYQQAAGYFRKILVNDPQAVRVRLELARTLFHLKQYTQSEREFRFARSGDLPKETNSIIDRYLAAIQYYQTVKWNFTLSLAPDDNINSAPDITRLGPDGVLRLDGFQKSSGIGALLNAGVEWMPRISPSIRFRVGANAYHANYSGSEFDDTVASFHLGPRFDFYRSRLSTLLTGYKRWYGQQEHSHSVGGRIEYTHLLNSRVRASVMTDYQEIRHHENKLNDGHRKGVRGSVNYALTESSGIQLSSGYFRERQQLDWNSSDTYRLSVGYYTELPKGINLFVQPEYTLTRYDAVNPLHSFFSLGDKKRKDETYRLNISLSNRQWSYKGFMPTLLLIHSQRNSNYELHNYSRNQIQLSLSKLF